jgi:integrase
VNPAEFELVLTQIPDRFHVLGLTAIETCLRWGALAALRPRHIDFLRRTITVQETIVEVSRKDSPTGQTVRH